MLTDNYIGAFIMSNGANALYLTTATTGAGVVCAMMLSYARDSFDIPNSSILNY